ncbi:hypothetical protein F5Y16DRAFT_368108 [Xylariaceae sp. FL0255]|nr:hypothetical protein F5Y16DRAFT_368108 [Xylariaceae sp. FL0255]
MGSIGGQADGISAFNINRIAIIGAGPCGLTAAKHLLAEGFKASQIDIYEQQAEVGGVWNHTPHKPAGDLQVPQTSAHVKPDQPLFPDQGEDDCEDEVNEEAEDDYDDDDDYEFQEACTAPGCGACSLPSFSRSELFGAKKKPVPLFPGAMYDVLNTNIPHPLMRFSDLNFTTDSTGPGTADGCEIFPTRDVVFEYLMRYARDVRDLIRFSTQVTEVTLQSPQVSYASPQARIQDKWTVKSMNLVTEMERRATYDAIVVATGHYTTPHIPAVAPDSLQDFHAAHPSVISHSKTYRSAAEFAGKKVLIIGSGPSGIDITRQIREVCAQPLVLSTRSGVVSEQFREHLGPKVRVVGGIERFLVEERGVEIRLPVDPDSVTSVVATEHITDLDAVIFCTGYLYTFPFFAPSFPCSPSSSTEEKAGAAQIPLITDGRRVNGLARHFLHVQHPTLVFPGLPMRVSPFPLAEGQATVFSRLWSNRLPLPSREGLEAWEREDEEGEGFEGPVPGGRWEGEWASHAFPMGRDGQYINKVREWALQADTEGGKMGKVPPHWGDEEIWQRSIFGKAKNKFEDTGRSAKSLVELGFVRE